MKPNYIVPASMIGYFILCVALSDFNIWIFFVNVFCAGCSISSQGIFLFEGRWTTAASGERDRNFGAILVTCLFAFVIGAHLVGLIIDTNQMYVETETRQKLSLVCGIAAALLIFLLDLAFVRRLHSLRRRGILLLIIILGIVLVWVMTGVSILHAPEVERATFRWWQSAKEALSQMRFNALVVFPILWPIAPGLALLRKAADGPEPAAPPVDPFLEPGETAKPPVTPQTRLAAARSGGDAQPEGAQVGILAAGKVCRRRIPRYTFAILSKTILPIPMLLH